MLFSGNVVSTAASTGGARYVLALGGGKAPRKGDVQQRWTNGPWNGRRERRFPTLREMLEEMRDRKACGGPPVGKLDEPIRLVPPASS